MGLAADLMDITEEPVPAAPSAHPSRRRRVVMAVAGVAMVTAAAGVVAAWRGGSDGVTDEGPAPAFDLPRVGMDGERVSLGDFAGRPVVVNFWASWCVPCRQEMPALQATSERLAGRVAFVGINYEDTESSAADFQRDVGAKYPSGLDSDGEVASRYAVQGLPTTVLVDGRGRIVARVLGGVTQKKLLSLVDKAFGPDVSGAG